MTSKLNVLLFQRAGAHDEKGNPIIRDFFGSPLTARYTSLVTASGGFK